MLIQDLYELANAPYPFNFVEPDHNGQLAKAVFTTKNGSKYEVVITPGYDDNGEHMEDKVSIEFSYKYFNQIPRSTQKITKTGDAYRIFGTVGRIVHKFLQDHPTIIGFDYGAGKNEPSRIKFYDTMARVLPKYIPNFNLSHVEEGYSFKYYHFIQEK